MEIVADPTRLVFIIVLYQAKGYFGRLTEASASPLITWNGKYESTLAHQDQAGPVPHVRPVDMFAL